MEDPPFPELFTDGAATSPGLLTSGGCAGFPLPPVCRIGFAVGVLLGFKVRDGVKVNVGVIEGVTVLVGVGVMLGVNPGGKSVGVLLAVGVTVLLGVIVGLGVKLVGVLLGVSDMLGVGVIVALGSTATVGEMSGARVLAYTIPQTTSTPAAKNMPIDIRQPEQDTPPGIG